MDSIVAGLLHHAERQPQAPAVIAPGTTLGYEDLRRGALAAAHWLSVQGVRAGDLVALALDHDEASAMRAVHLVYGVAYLGCVLLPLYPDVPPATRAGLLRRFGARWLVSKEPAVNAPGAAWIQADGFDPASSPAADPPRADHPDRPALLHFTSGTTGTPKVCVFTFWQAAHWLLNASNSLRSSPRDRVVAARPWPELVGLRAMLRTHLTGGALVNVTVPQSAGELAALVRDLGVTELMLSPFQMRVLLRNTAAHEARGAPLRVLYVGGGFVSPAEVEAVRRSVTPNLYLDYGSNETGRLALFGPGDPSDRFGCVGKILSSVQAEVVDARHQPVPQGVVGTLRFRAAWMPQAYLGNDLATAERFIDGWFYPGDFGSIDAQGYLTLGGRTDDVINSGGLKIDPAEIEAVLMQHPDIEDAALAGVPDPMSGQLAVAFLVSRRPVAAADLQAFCRERMEAMRVPFVFASVNQIPRNREGKVLRDRLREAYADRLAKRLDDPSSKQ